MGCEPEAFEDQPGGESVLGRETEEKRNEGRGRVPSFWYNFRDHHIKNLDLL